MSKKMFSILIMILLLFIVLKTDILFSHDKKGREHEKSN